MKHDSQEEKILAYIKQPAIQSNLQALIKQTSSKITTSIGEMANIVGVTEPQMRYWEAKGYLSPIRNESSGKPSGERHYGLPQLVRLLIIKELLNKGFELGSIGAFFDTQKSFLKDMTDTFLFILETNQQQQTLADRISQAKKALFWRTFVPRVTYLSMRLFFKKPISGDAGLFLPVQKKSGFSQGANVDKIDRVEDLPGLGELLIGWHGRNDPFCLFHVHHINRAFLESLRLQTVTSLEWFSEDDNDWPNIHLLVEPYLADSLRQKNDPAYQTAERLLRFLQEHASDWRTYLQSTTDYMAYSPPSLINASLDDHLLDEFAETLIQFGGKEQGKKDLHWKFATIFLPLNPLDPLQQRSLVVRGHSKNSPHQTGLVNHAGSRPTGISMLAYQSGQVVYRPNLADGDLDIGLRSDEDPVSSAIAIPLAGEYGQPIGVLYVTSNEANAFSDKSDQILLRMMERIISEMVITYQTRRLISGKLSEVITRPEIVDSFFGDFDTQNRFSSQVEELLHQMESNGTQPFAHLSFIAINVDGSTGVAAQYGGHAERNIIRAVGQRIREWVKIHSKERDIYLFYMFADRFYLLLRDVSLETTGEYAQHLWEVLRAHPYLIEATRVSQDQQILSGRRLSLTAVTSHLAVTGYEYEKLRSMFKLDPKAANIRARMVGSLEEGLRLGRDEGGDNVVIWDRKSEKFVAHRDPTIPRNIGGEQPIIANAQVLAELLQTYEPRIRTMIEEEFEKLQANSAGSSDDSKGNAI